MPWAELCFLPVFFPATRASPHLHSSQNSPLLPRHVSSRYLARAIPPTVHLPSISPINTLPAFQGHVSMLYPPRKEIAFSGSLPQKGLHVALIVLLLLVYPACLYLIDVNVCLIHPLLRGKLLRPRNMSLVFDFQKHWTQFPASQRCLLIIGPWEFLMFWFETIDSPQLMSLHFIYLVILQRKFKNCDGLYKRTNMTYLGYVFKQCPKRSWFHVEIYDELMLLPVDFFPRLVT